MRERGLFACSPLGPVLSRLLYMVGLREPFQPNWFVFGHPGGTSRGLKPSHSPVQATDPTIITKSRKCFCLSCRKDATNGGVKTSRTRGILRLPSSLPTTENRAILQDISSSCCCMTRGGGWLHRKTASSTHTSAHRHKKGATE